MSDYGIDTRKRNSSSFFCANVKVQLLPQLCDSGVVKDFTWLGSGFEVYVSTRASSNPALLDNSPGTYGGIIYIRNLTQKSDGR